MNLNLFERIRGGLIVSCQAEGDDPFNTPEGVTLFARTAEMGGACAIRSQGLEKTRQIIKNVQLPVIGLLKTKFPDGTVCITREWDGILALRDLGVAMVAVDGTQREYDNMTGPQFIQRIKMELNIPVMADIATEAEAIAAANAGADCVSTTLNGYTPETAASKTHDPNYDLVTVLSQKLAPLPVIAEGRVSAPEQAAQMIRNGAWAVVVGTAITRPRMIVSWYCNALENVNSTN